MACTAPEVVEGGVLISTNPLENAKDLLTALGGDDGDPTNDEYEENVANGNNASGTTGVQFPPPAQSAPPSEIKEKPEEIIEEVPPPKEGEPVLCSNPYLPDGVTVNYDFALSGNFKLRDFTVNAYFPNALTDVSGYTKEERCCNLMALATNIAEPLLAKFGTMGINSTTKINSGLRNTSSSSAISQHFAGEAMDVQYAGWTYDRYWENAAWIKDNLPYDQFIFEHSSSTGLAWYHLSYKRTGTQRRKVLTMYRNQYSNGLLKFK